MLATRAYPIASQRERIRSAIPAANLVQDWLQNWLGADDDKEVVMHNQEVPSAPAIPPFLGDARSGTQSAMAAFIFGVITPNASPPVFEDRSRRTNSDGPKTEGPPARILFENASPGTRVTQEGDGEAEIDLSIGFPMRGKSNRRRNA